MTPELPNYSPDPSLTPVQHRVLALLAEGQSLTEAAAQAGVHRNTVRNWRRSVPAFARDCEFAVREQAVAWHDHLLQLAPQAAQVLHSVLHDESASPSLRLRAAVAVLKASADPHPKPLALIGTVTAELEALNGYCLAQKPPVVHNEIPKTRTMMHNAPMRLPPEPGRNSLCPCGSGQKFKRCCANRARAATAT